MPTSEPPDGALPGVNVDAKVVSAFGSEWQRFDHGSLDEREARELFNRYFEIFPWHSLSPNAEGFDAGCGSGRWARLVAPRVGLLHCVDASAAALRVAERNLASQSNCRLHLATIDSMPMREGALDFGYSLGVLHHIPDTESALRACVRKLKPGAPFLLYLYYAFDNRPGWFRAVWKVSEVGRTVLSRSPFWLKSALCDVLAGVLYLPLARGSRLAKRMGADVDNIPLSAYRDQSFYVMRTDALDRFGTRVEKRFTRDQVRRMMEEAGLEQIRFNEAPPYWVAVGVRSTAATTFK